MDIEEMIVYFDRRVEAYKALSTMLEWIATSVPEGTDTFAITPEELGQFRRQAEVVGWDMERPPAIYTSWGTIQTVLA